MQTEQDSIIGGYCPDQWEDTTGKKDSLGNSDFKDITSGSPFLFYWVNDEIQIMKHKDDKIAVIGCNHGWLMMFAMGLWINADQYKQSYAFANNNYWVHP